MVNMSKIPVFHLFIPQLLQPLCSWEKDFLFDPKCNNFPHLFKSLGATNIQKVHGLAACFFSSLGSNIKELPLAHYRFKMHRDCGLDRMTQSIMCADPIHLEVGMNDIILTEKISDLTDEEALELIEILNQHFKLDGLEFIFGTSQHWYISFPADELVQTTPIDLVLKKNISGFLATSPQRNWQRIQNEVQMLLHSAAVNQNREMAGLVPVNSLWFWGGGQPQQSKHQVQKLFCSDETQGKTFAMVADCNWQALPREGDQLLKNASGLNFVILDQLFMPAIHDNLEAYQHELSSIDENYIKPLLQAWQQNNIDLIIHDCNGIKIKPLKVPVWKFWKKPKSLLQIAKETSAEISQ
jgi:hypothetical protein